MYILDVFHPKSFGRDVCYVLKCIFWKFNFLFEKRLFRRSHL